MSWILGVFVQNLSSAVRDRVASMHYKPIHQFDTSDLYVTAGGIKETCVFGSFAESAIDNSSGWLVVGLGIKKKGRSLRFLIA
ncbi:MAG: hypothetical protein O7D34_03935 [Ignavibacteria bacterium]|nr:hypothetical protein [Ignavibacteria bacterium]